MTSYHQERWSTAAVRLGDTIEIGGTSTVINSWLCVSGLHYFKGREH